MSEREPITAELRGKMDTLGWYDEDGNIVFTTGGTPVSEIACLAINSKTFGELCDAIDAVHAGLERENAELRQRVAVLEKRGDSMHDGGSITGELREWWVRKFPVMDKKLHKNFTAIADRIDAEHQKAIRELNNLADGCVLLPVDADGEYIHIGDVMENIVCPSVHREVTGVGVECFYGWDENNGRYSQFDVNCYRHYHAPTVEDVLTKFGIDWEYEDNCEDRAALLAEYASKLRLASNEE